MGSDYLNKNSAKLQVPIYYYRRHPPKVMRVDLNVRHVSADILD